MFADENSDLVVNARLINRCMGTRVVDVKGFALFVDQKTGGFTVTTGLFRLCAESETRIGLALRTLK